jgi:hypothetical protein
MNDPLINDAPAYATAQGIPLEEAVRRLNLQGAIGQLSSKLEVNERETFAGLWIQHQPEYRVVVRFTRDGERTLRSYVENTPLASLVEVRPANLTYAELQAAQAETMHKLNSLDFVSGSGINVQENRVELYVTNRAKFEAELQKANLKIPEAVFVIEVGTPDTANAAMPPPGIYFPRQSEAQLAKMAALLIGTLVLDEQGCLRVKTESLKAQPLVIWPYDFTVNKDGGAVMIRDGKGQIIGLVGEEIQLGGGEIPAEAFEKRLREPLPKACPGPYWFTGDVVVTP